MVSRADRGVFAEWWWTVDKLMLATFVALMVAGVVLSLAGSPPVAERLGLDSFHFVKRHMFFFVPALVVLFATSLLTPRQARRMALLVFAVMIVLMVATLFFGQEIKGARRWIDFHGIAIQPSEFMKPAFVVLAAWLFSENGRRSDIPGNIFAFLLLGMVAALLVAQPDFGQTMLISIAWGTLFFLAGMPWLLLIGIVVLGVVGAFGAYSTFPHVAARIDRFLDPSSGDTYQIDTAKNSFLSGGWFGQGPGEGIVKRGLPDSHTDFIFAVAAEEFGIIMCLLLLTLFAFIVVRGLGHARRDEEPFTRLAAAGLTVLFGVQAAINMAVNLHLMPAKGMTLPFISYGGSSMIAVAFEAGLILAFTRRRREPVRIARNFAQPQPYAG